MSDKDEIKITGAYYDRKMGKLKYLDLKYYNGRPISQ